VSCNCRTVGTLFRAVGTTPVQPRYSLGQFILSSSGEVLRKVVNWNAIFPHKISPSSIAGFEIITKRLFVVHQQIVVVKCENTLRLLLSHTQLIATNCTHVLRDTLLCTKMCGLRLSQFVCVRFMSMVGGGFESYRYGSELLLTTATLCRTKSRHSVNWQYKASDQSQKQMKPTRNHKLKKILTPLFRDLFIHSCILQSALRQVHGFFQSQFSMQ